MVMLGGSFCEGQDVNACSNCGIARWARKELENVGVNMLIARNPTPSLQYLEIHRNACHRQQIAILKLGDALAKEWCR